MRTLNLEEKQRTGEPEVGPAKCKLPPVKHMSTRRGVRAAGDLHSLGLQSSKLRGIYLCGSRLSHLLNGRKGCGEDRRRMFCPVLSSLSSAASPNLESPFLERGMAPMPCGRGHS